LRQELSQLLLATNSRLFRDRMILSRSEEATDWRADRRRVPTPMHTEEIENVAPRRSERRRRFRPVSQEADRSALSTARRL
jgi:hypothetical protein